MAQSVYTAAPTSEELIILRVFSRARTRLQESSLAFYTHRFVLVKTGNPNILSSADLQYNTSWDSCLWGSLRGLPLSSEKK